MSTLNDTPSTSTEATQGWGTRPLVGFDVETTSADVETARIVQAAIYDTEAPATCWLIDPGVEIPQSAADIHGISTEHAQAHGVAPAQALIDIRERIATAKEAEEILVGHNIVFDLTILDRESRRHLPDEVPVGEILGVVLDTMVIDKHLDTYRPGKRTLEVTAAHYGVTIDSAHDATFDAKAAVQIAQQIIARYPVFSGKLTPGFLMNAQPGYKAGQAASLQSYLRRVKDPATVVEPSWPLIPYGKK